MSIRGRPYLRYQLGGGNWAAIEFEDVGILNQYQYKNDFFGETNHALDPTMQLLNAQNQGIIEGIKQSATIRFLAKLAQPLRPEDIDKERQRFIKANLSADNNGGVMLVDTKYDDVKQIESRATVINAAQKAAIEENVYTYFNTNKAILQSSFNEDEWNAYYEGRARAVCDSTLARADKYVILPARASVRKFRFLFGKPSAIREQ